jgi:hypothetical protein
VQRGGMNLDGIHEACVIISTTVPPTLESCDK